MKQIIQIGLLVFGVIVVVRLLIPPQSMEGIQTNNQVTLIFENPIKSDHWVNNTPQHASSFAAPPVNVVADLDADIVGISEITIRNESDRDYGVGPTMVDPGRRSMRRAMDPEAPDGIYTVLYKPCWSDGECHKGSFEFAIDRRLADSFEDHRGRADIPPDIEIHIEQGSFMPKKIRIRKNTRVIWKNNDTVDHTVTTDTYPTNSYFVPQQSEVLKPGDAFQVVFSEPGEYPYHSSQDPEGIAGSLLVE